MNKTTNHWFRSGLSMLLALCLIFGAPVMALASTDDYCNTAEAEAAVDSAVNYCSQAQKIVDMVVSYFIDHETYSSFFSGSSTSSFMKSIIIDMIIEQLDSREDLMTQIGMEPTSANKEMLAEEIYDVACIYYDEMNRTNRTNANRLAVIEVVRFALVEVRGYTNADAQETAELYHELNSIKASEGKDAAVAHALSVMGTVHNYVDGICTGCGDEDPNYVAPTEPVETEPVETEPVETEPVETEPVETEPVETEPVETEPVETEPVETEPVETEPVETEPVETEPEEDDNDASSSLGNLFDNLFGNWWGSDDNEDEEEEDASSSNLGNLFDKLFGNWWGSDDEDEEPAPTTPAPSEPGETEPEEDDSKPGFSFDLGDLLGNLFGWLN